MRDSENDKERKPGQAQKYGTGTGMLVCSAEDKPGHRSTRNTTLSEQRRREKAEEERER